MLERAGSHDKSLKIILEGLQSRNIELSLDTIGHGLQTVIANLKDESERTSGGIGKGVGLQSICSALGEALEHFIHKYEPTEFETIDISEMFEDDWFSFGSPNFTQITKEKEGRLTVDLFSNMLAGSVLKYPHFLSNPQFKATDDGEKQYLERFDLMRYSCNTGTAFGLVKQEAQLHALLELIERDSISIFLIETIYRRPARDVEVLTIESLPENLKSLTSRICERGFTQVELFRATTHLGIPAYIACGLRIADGAVFFGSGASVSSSYAIERALLEVLQCSDSQTYHCLPPPIPPSVETISLFPNYIRGLMDKGVFHPSGTKVLVKYFEEIDIGSHEMAVDRQLDLILGKLKKAGIDCFSRSLKLPFLNTENWHVEQVVAPRLERFYLSASGLFVVPSFRGNCFLHGKLE